MKLNELIEVSLSAHRIPVDVANELLEYGISAFLGEGVSYAVALDILARAEIAHNRRAHTAISFPEPEQA
jgi:hypothetical protein